MTLTESCYQLDSSEYEWLRKLLSPSEWRFIITTSFDCPPPPPSLPVERRGEGEKEEETDLKRERLINHLGLERIRLLLNWNHLLEEPLLPDLRLFTTPTIWEPVEVEYFISELKWALFPGAEGEFTLWRSNCWQMRAVLEAKQTKWPFITLCTL